MSDSGQLNSDVRPSPEVWAGWVRHAGLNLAVRHFEYAFNQVKFGDDSWKENLQIAHEILQKRFNGGIINQLLKKNPYHVILISGLLDGTIKHRCTVIPVDTENVSGIGGSGVQVEPKLYNSKEELITEFKRVAPDGLAALSGDIESQQGAEGMIYLTEGEAIQLGL